METVEFFIGRTSYMVHFDMVEMGKFLEQTACSLIYGCKTYTPKENAYPGKSEIGKIHMTYTQYAQHGYINSLMTQANFIKSFVYSCVQSNTIPYLIERNIALLLTDALTMFQTYKSLIIADEQKNHGENFGCATGFNKANWSEYNQLFMELWNKEGTK